MKSMETIVQVERVATIRRSRSTGRSVGAKEWLAALERNVGRPMIPAKRGPKPKAATADDQAELFSAVSP